MVLLPQYTNPQRQMSSLLQTHHESFVNSTRDNMTLIVSGALLLISLYRLVLHSAPGHLLVSGSQYTIYHSTLFIPHGQPVPRPPTAEARFQSQASAWRVYGGQRGSRIGFSAIISALPCQLSIHQCPYRYYIHTLSMLCKFY